MSVFFKLEKFKKYRHSSSVHSYTDNLFQARTDAVNNCVVALDTESDFNCSLTAQLIIITFART